VLHSGVTLQQSRVTLQQSSALPLVLRSLPPRVCRCRWRQQGTTQQSASLRASTRGRIRVCHLGSPSPRPTADSIYTTTRGPALTVHQQDQQSQNIRRRVQRSNHRGNPTPTSTRRKARHHGAGVAAGRKNLRQWQSSASSEFTRADCQRLDVLTAAASSSTTRTGGCHTERSATLT
jgi:hypothetical protein